MTRTLLRDVGNRRTGSRARSERCGGPKMAHGGRTGQDDANSWIDHLKSKLENRTAVVGVVGLGHVGLPLSIEFAKKFQVHGFDINLKLVKDLERGKSHIDGVPDTSLGELVGKSLFPSGDERALRMCDFIIVSVPTPLTDAKEPDLRPV